MFHVALRPAQTGRHCVLCRGPGRMTGQLLLFLRARARVDKIGGRGGWGPRGAVAHVSMAVCANEGPRGRGPFRQEVTTDATVPASDDVTP